MTGGLRGKYGDGVQSQHYVALYLGGGGSSSTVGKYTIHVRRKCVWGLCPWGHMHERVGRRLSKVR